MKPPTDLAHSGVDQLEIIGAAEPRFERLGDPFGTLPFHRTRWQQGSKADRRPQRGGHQPEIAVGEGLEERASH